MYRLLLILLITNQTIYAQNDWAEYGFMGKVKKVELTRKSTINGETYTYKNKLIFNSQGNVDTIYSNTNSNQIDSALIIIVYQFKNNRKCGWREYNSAFKLKAFATIVWQGDSSYTEKKYNPDSSCKGESIYYLKSNFNSYKIMDYTATDQCAMELVSTILFNRPQFGPAKSMQFIPANTDQIEETVFTIIKKDQLNNPTETIGKNGKTTNIAIRTYTYF